MGGGTLGGQRRRPVDPTAPHALRELVGDLRRITDARFESLRALEKVAHVGRSTLSDALSGRRLPSLDVVTAIVRACGDDEAAWQVRWHTVRVTLLEHTDSTDDTHPATDHVDAAAVVTPLQAGDPRRAGPFRLRGVLGAGAMSRVFLAHAPGGQAVAVKLVRAEFADDPEFRRRFRHEVEAARAVHSPFTVPVVAADPDAARPWLATIYVPGPSLRSIITADGPLPTETVTRIATAVIEALRAIHAAGVVHRDLNPGNVLLAPDGPKVIDFGIARAADASHLTRTGAPVGTAAFMAPEQATGTDISPATDVFSLGALLTYAATGAAPFGDGPPEAILYRVVHAEPDVDQVHDPRLRAVIGQCLAKDPDQRPTLDEVLLRLDPTTPLGDEWPPPALAAELARHIPPRPRRLTGRRVAVVAAVMLAATLATTAILTDTTNGTHPANGPTPTIEPGTTTPSATNSGGRTAPNGPISSTTANSGSGVAAPPHTAPLSLAGDIGQPPAAHSGPTGGSAPVARSGGGAGAVAVASARVSFEDGDDDWGAFYGGDKLVHTVTTQVAYDGTHSLLLTTDPGNDDACAIGTDRTPGLTAGAVVTLHIWYGGQGHGEIRPFVQDTHYDNHFQSTTPLRATGWTTVTFTIPNIAFKGIGFQIDNTGSGNLVLALDAVNW